VLVRNGIEHAQLQLRPADLGPIEVRIRVDGHEAQVDFSAAHAATRQALQDAVPALAGALRDSGLTLTGGGVYEQARDPRDQPQPQAARAQAGAAVDDGAAALQAPTARGVRARGVVDLYA
jgi:flagellar hook-length control protein FliK